MNQTTIKTRPPARLPTACSVLLLLTSLLASPAQGKEGTLYDIEVIVYARTSAQAGTSEAWRPPEFPEIPAGAIDTSRGPAPSAGILRTLDAQAFTLTSEAGKLQRSRRYTLLAHRAWRQAGMPKSTAPLVRIRAGSSSDSAWPALDGTMQVYLARYLHVNLDLWYTRKAAAPVEPVAVSAPEDGAGMQPARTAAWSPFVQQQFRMQTHRRMRSGELHYIDHPLLGVLVQISKVSSE